MLPHSSIARTVPLSVRPLALPSEHGAWGLLLEPIVLGLIVAPSGAGFLLALGALAAFLARHPLKLAAQDWLRGKRYPRTAVCELLVAAHLIASALAFASAWRLAGWMPLLAIVPAIPLAAIQFRSDVRMRGRSAVAELCGAAAPSVLATAVVVAGGRGDVGVALALLMLARAIPSVLFVRYALGPHPALRATLSRARERAFVLTAHLVGVGISIALLNPAAVVAMIILFARSMLTPDGLPAKAIGFREVGWGVLTVVLVAAGYRI